MQHASQHIFVIRYCVNINFFASGRQVCYFSVQYKWYSTVITCTHAAIIENGNGKSEKMWFATVSTEDFLLISRINESEFDAISAPWIMPNSESNVQPTRIGKAHLKHPEGTTFEWRGSQRCLQRRMPSSTRHSHQTTDVPSTGMLKSNLDWNYWTVHSTKFGVL